MGPLYTHITYPHIVSHCITLYHNVTVRHDQATQSGLLPLQTRVGTVGAPHARLRNQRHTLTDGTMGNIYSYRHDRVGMDGESGSGSGSEGKNTGLGAELDGGGARNPKREDAGRDGPPGLTSLRVSRGGGEAQAPSMPSMPPPASSPAPSPAPSTSSSQEESFFGWRRKSEEQGGDGAVAGQSGAFSDPGWSFGGHGGADGDGDGRLSLAETIPLEETFPEMRLEDGASGGKLRGAGYDSRIDDVSSQVPQGHDTPMVPNLGSSSGTRSVGSGGSRSMQSQEGKESHHRGSLEGGDIGDDRYGMQRRASGTSARGSLTLERANARANRSSFDAFQKALEDQVRSGMNFMMCVVCCVR